MLKKDLHVHLHGCLTAEALWKIGLETYKNRQEELHWYAKEFKQAWGRDPGNYWHENGLEILKNDFHFLKNNKFERFQASFNLIIALCPLKPADFSVQDLIIRDVSKHGLEYFEARTVIPLYFNRQETLLYLEGLCRKVLELNNELSMETKLVFSLFRSEEIATQGYAAIRDFISAKPDLGEIIVGIDFAFAEKGHPPKNKVNFFKKFHEDNNKYSELSAFYHVGEAFDDKSMLSAIRWIAEVVDLGVDRIGHGIALGADPMTYLGLEVHEEASEYRDTLTWLIKNSEILAEYGYLGDKKAWQRELAELSAAKVKISYDLAYVEEVRALQTAVCAWLKSKGAVIEVCPSSNLRIGQLKLDQHPLKFFHQQGIDYVLGTDDPGIFAIDWRSEYELTERIINLS